MQIDNPIRLVRELKGAPLSIVLVLQFVTQRVTQEYLERSTGYTDKPVRQALEYLREIGMVDHTREGWLLCQAQQLVLGLGQEELTAETQRSDEVIEGGEEQEKSDTDGVSRNNSDSIAAAALNNLSLSCINDLSCCCSEEGRKNSDSDGDGGEDERWNRDLVRAILKAEGIGPPKLERLAAAGFDPLWVRAHVGKWRGEEKSKGILIVRLECGDKIRYDHHRVEQQLQEEFPDFWEWDDDVDGS